MLYIETIFRNYRRNKEENEKSQFIFTKNSWLSFSQKQIIFDTDVFLEIGKIDQNVILFPLSIALKIYSLTGVHL